MASLFQILTPQKKQFLFNVTFYMYKYKILYKEYSNYSKKHYILP